MANKKFQLVFIIGWIQILLGCSIIFDIYELPLFIFAILGVGIIGLRSWARIPSIFCWGLYILGNLNFMKGQYELWKGISPAQPLLKLFHMLLPSVFWIFLCIFAIVSLTRPQVKEQFMNKDISRMKKRSVFIFMIFLLVSITCYFYFPTVTPHRDKPIRKLNGEFSGKKGFAFSNLTLLVVDAGNEKCTFNFQLSRRSWDGAPEENLDLNIGGQDFKVTSHDVGNNQLKVNDVVYKFDSGKEHLLINQNGNPVPEAGDINPSVQFLLTPPDEKPKTPQLNILNLNVRAENINSAQVQVAPVTPPMSPTGLTATAGNGTVTLTWTVVTGPTGYNIYRSVGGGAYTLFNGTPIPYSNVNYTDGTVVNGTTYSYEMTAVNAAGESARSAPVSVKSI